MKFSICAAIAFSICMACGEKPLPIEPVANASQVEINYGHAAVDFRYGGGLRTYLAQSDSGDGILSIYNGSGAENALYSFNGLGLYYSDDPLNAVVSLDNWGQLYFSDNAKNAGIYFGRHRVLGKQQPAIPDPHGPDDIIATQKAILAAMRAHGLIAEQ